MAWEAQNFQEPAGGSREFGAVGAKAKTVDLRTEGLCKWINSVIRVEPQVPLFPLPPQRTRWPTRPLLPCCSTFVLDTTRVYQGWQN